MINNEKNLYLSVIVICKNEEINIKKCLSSLYFAEEVILVDSGSTDKTLEIAKQFPNVKIFETSWLGYSGTKEFAITKTKNNWVFWIDSDEVVTDSLANEWKQLSHKLDLDSVGAISVFRKTYFLGHFVKHWYPEKVVRIFHKERAKFNTKLVHEGLNVDKNFKVIQFNNWIDHYSYHSFSQYFSKMIVYGQLGAQQLKNSNRSISILQLFLSPVWAFFKNYFLRKGFLDGLIGFIICMGSSFSSFIKYSIYFFIQKYNHVENIDRSNF